MKYSSILLILVMFLTIYKFLPCIYDSDYIFEFRKFLLLDKYGHFTLRSFQKILKKNIGLTRENSNRISIRNDYQETDGDQGTMDESGGNIAGKHAGQSTGGHGMPGQAIAGQGISGQGFMRKSVSTKDTESSPKDVLKKLLEPEFALERALKALSNLCKLKKKSQLCKCPQMKKYIKGWQKKHKKNCKCPKFDEL